MKSQGRSIPWIIGFVILLVAGIATAQIDFSKPITPQITSALTTFVGAAHTWTAAQSFEGNVYPYARLWQYGGQTFRQYDTGNTGYFEGLTTSPGSYTVSTSHAGTHRFEGMQVATSTVQVDDITTGAATIDFNEGNTHSITVDENLTAITVSNMYDGASYSVLFCYTGDYTVDWSDFGTVKWIGGAEPADNTSTTSGSCDLLVLKKIGSAVIGDLALDVDEP